MKSPFLLDMGFQTVGIRGAGHGSGTSIGMAQLILRRKRVRRAAFLLVCYGHFPNLDTNCPIGGNHGKKQSLGSATQRHSGSQICPFV
jgi:hypothetical protein